MLDIKMIRTETEKVKAALARRKEVVDIDKVLELDNKRRELVFEAEQLKKKQNEVSKQIPQLKKAGEEFKLLVLPDHATPVPKRTHTRGMVPFFVYDSRNKIKDGGFVFSEKTARNRKLRIEKGCDIMGYFLGE